MSIVAFEKFHGYLVGEEGATRGLVVIQEWWGLNEDIKSIATRYSKEGFLVLAPDLYYGKIAHNADEAHHFMDGLDWHDAQAMVSAGARLLKSKGAKAVGVTGFCMGGAITVAAAVNDPEISAAAPFYGIPPAEIADPTKTRVPVQAHFGREDEQKGFSDPVNAVKLEAALVKSGVKYELH
ncbi:dienelactone hydrolase, partial [Jimgerdemannia flammicorona]